MTDLDEHERTIASLRAALAEKDAESKRWKADYHAACNEMAKARGKAADAQLRLDFLVFDRDEEAEQHGGQFAKLWTGLKAAVKENARLQARVTELEPLHTFLLEHGPDLMLYTKPQVEGLKRPCRDALGEVMKRMVEK